MDYPHGPSDVGFEEAQARHCKHIQSRKSGLQWTVELIKTLMDVSWDMWEHRNNVLRESPEQHHKADELEEANASIDLEWTRGPAGMLRQNLFLFRNRPAVNKRSLARKLEWLEAVTEARHAADEASKVKKECEPEQRFMDNYLIRENKKRRLTAPQRVTHQ